MLQDIPKTQDVVYTLATSPDFKRDGVCFAAQSSGLYQSRDGGRTWQVGGGLSNLGIPVPTFTVALSPIFHRDGRAFAGVSGGILRTVDGGSTWDSINLPPPTPIVSTLAVSPNFEQDGTAFAGTLEDGVFVSTDRGEHWTAWNFGLLDLHILSMAITDTFQSDETIFVGTESGIARSTNGGRAWREIGAEDGAPTLFDLAPVLWLALSPHYSSDGCIFAGTESNGVARSTDSGTSWERIGETTVLGAVNAILLATSFPAQPDILILQSDGIFVSRDGGKSWTQQQVPFSATEPGRDTQPSLSAVAAPCGIERGSPLLVGLTDGKVVCLCLA